MSKFRVERTELHTRVWFIEATSADDAMERFLEDGEEDEAQSYHSGHPDLTITEEPESL